MKASRFAAYAWSVLAYNVAVILWGALVRATGSGAGCGDHWPLCNGQVLPRAAQTQTLIEFTHRTTSGLAGIVIIILVVWAFRAFPKGHAVRRAATLSLVFVIFEGLIGAALVKLGLVATNDSVARAAAMSLHLVNTLILLAVLALTAWWATAERAGDLAANVRRQRGLAWALAACLVGTIFLAASGAVIALGATLFPVKSAAQGLAQDLSPAAHFLVRLRLIHPIFAVAFSLFVVFTAVTLSLTRQSREVVTLARAQVALFILQLIIGGVNLALHAPVWLQLVHLLAANLVWVSLVLMAESALAAGAKAGFNPAEGAIETSHPAAANPAELISPGGGRESGRSGRWS
jgi:heme A synthase